MTEPDYQAVVIAMTDIGRELQREDVLDCFCENALRRFISEQRKSASTSKMFAKLQASVDARAEVHELERGMDKDHFVELVTGGYFMASGVDKKTKFPILWLDTGAISRGSWAYKFGSPRGQAFVR